MTRFRMLLALPALGLLLFAVAPRGTAADPKEEAAKDLKSLQGTWDTIATWKDGKELPKPTGGGMLIVEGSKWTVQFGGKTAYSGMLTVDTSKTPRTFDMTETEGPEKGRTVHGIYEFKGDELKMAWTEPPSKERPADFSGKTGMMVVAKKAK